MTDMPDGTLYGRLTGRVSAFIGDTPADTDNLPDRVPTGGRVTITPSITHVIHKPTGDVIFATPDPIDLDGDGHFDAMLVAVDSPDLNPTGWYYTVRHRRAALTARVQVLGGQSITLGEAVQVAAGTHSMQIQAWIESGSGTNHTTVMDNTGYTWQFTPGAK